ncbi:MAG: major capsid protein [Thermoplasmatales archaeon]
MAKLFNQVRIKKQKRNVFDLGHERKFSMNMGDLVPILCEEVIPGDTFKMNSEVFLRMAPLVAPIMHRVNVYTHFFFVPNRLIWQDWEKFITGGENGNELPIRPFGRIASSNYQSYGKGSLADYLGVSVFQEPQVPVEYNALPFRAYQLIYNEYYRDQNLESPIIIRKTSGLLDANEYEATRVIRKRAWEKDYFTSALPWTQRGGDVHLPLSGEADIMFKEGGQTFTKFADGTIRPNVQTFQSFGNGELEETQGDAFTLDNSSSLQADLTSATASTIEELRRATKLQQWLERNARTGSRYIEQILAHFGVRSSDARLQRPEFLGGGKSPVTISEVLQTSSTDTTSPQANMAGHAISVGSSHTFKKFFEEHGYVIGIMSILPKTAYMQGTRRHFYKSDKFDYYWPEFAQLGEQPVYKGELWSDFDGDDLETFGYQSRYAEYKFIPSTVHGDFKDNLDHWHMSRKFANEPALNEQFIKADPTQRVFAVTDPNYPKVYVQLYNNLKAIRPIPYFNTPML